MMNNFDKCVEKMRHDYLPSLQNMDAIPLSALNSAQLPEAGIYVLYEGSTPVYVGRTGKMKARLKQHGYKNSNHFSASFAFILAKKSALAKGVDCNRNRKELAADPGFGFKEAKYAVSCMSFRYVAIIDPIEQTLFEVYAALELNTEHNSFDSH